MKHIMVCRCYCYLWAAMACTWQRDSDGCSLLPLSIGNLR